MELTSAAMGGKKDTADGEIGIDDGDGLDEISDESLEEMREMLGDHDFYLAYPSLKPED